MDSYDYMVMQTTINLLKQISWEYDGMYHGNNYTDKHNKAMSVRARDLSAVLEGVLARILEREENDEEH